ncbi:MAG: DNA-binding protein WhiA, partial [Firmicutes bacterium]|nr:DNA-binding protein WhiA [Bacillota bacterium]
NRGINCDAANLDKRVGAAQKHIAAIKLIDSVKGIESLPDKLYITALKRMEFPELALSDLAKEVDPKLTKSGLNHRLNKISEIADKLR